MFSPQLLNKWKKFLKKKYGFKNPTSKETVEFASTLTNFFDLLIKFSNEDQMKNDKRRKLKKS